MNSLDGTHVLDAYAGAWNTRSPVARLRLLNQSCRPDVRFDDPFTQQFGVSALAGYIGSVQRAWPGCLWLPQGEPVCQGRQVLLRWRWVRARLADVDGDSRIELHATGRIARVAAGVPAS